MYIRLLVIICLLMMTNVVVGQNFYTPPQDNQKIIYRVNQTWIDSSYHSNSSSLKAIKDILTGGMTIRSICIAATSSPEGSADKNTVLSQKRAQALADLILSSLSDRQQIPEIRISYTPENWTGLTETVRNAYYRSNRNMVMAILEDDSISDKTRKWKLRQIDNGETWDFMKRHYMPGLRLASIEDITFGQDFPIASLAHIISEPIHVKSLHETGLKYPASVHSDIEDRTEGGRKNGFTAAVRTNLLYDAVLVPNIGLEFHLGKGWAATAGWNYAWWDRDAGHRYWRVYGGELEIKKYFGTAAQKRPLSGHHLGLYGQGFTYDFELGGRGQISELSYGCGIAYGYALPVGRSFNLDFGIGLGYLGGEYKIYDPEDGCYVWKETRQRHWMGPTKAEVSLVWVIGRKGPQWEKGGRR